MWKKSKLFIWCTAYLNGSKSKVKTNKFVNFCFPPLHLAIIEPPAVQAEATTPGVLIVQITDPLVSRDGGKYSIKHFYGHGFVTYKMRIWKKDYDGEQVEWICYGDLNMLLHKQVQESFSEFCVSKT